MAKIFTIIEGLENMGALKTGGQGSVYKARRTGGIITAVKLLPTPIYSESLDDKHFSDFQSEVNKLKKVNKEPNPNVVKILSSGITETGSLPFIEMEYIEGPDLEELLRPPHDPIFTIAEVIKVADKLSNALSHCHKAGVKHGDIKSNNVKFNINSGNYMLLDFGMAMISDEQRRTSLRHAGAIEFMAPEQNEGHILFQTDVYSFGIILFELLAGTVPFPLRDKSESARNAIMLAHLEKGPPDILSLRSEAMPSSWSEEKKALEMQVPEWLLTTTYICLQKKPESRFADGMVLHNYIVSHYRNTVDVSASDEIQKLQKQIKQLLLEKELLQQQILQYKDLVPANSDASENYNPYIPPKKKGGIHFWKIFLWILIITMICGLSFFGYRQVNYNDKKSRIDTVAIKPKQIFGQYKVLSARAYFYDQPDYSTRRAAYMIPSTAVVTALNDTSGFIYAEHTNTAGQQSKGWLSKTDLMTLDQWNQQQVINNAKKENIRLRLANAKRLMSENRVAGAVSIYSLLAEEKVPEAMYEYGNLGLQYQIEEINCDEAFLLVKSASDMGYIPAKRTLGILYYYADDTDVLESNNYENCSYEKSVYKGTKLLKEAAAAGDAQAKILYREIKISKDSLDRSKTEEKQKKTGLKKFIEKIFK